MTENEIITVSGGIEDIEAVLGRPVEASCVVSYHKDYKKPRLAFAVEELKKAAAGQGCIGLYHVVREILPVPLPMDASGRGSRYNYLVYVEGIGVKEAGGR